jgi:hypothetical protein
MSMNAAASSGTPGPRSGSTLALVTACGLALVTACGGYHERRALTPPPSGDDASRSPATPGEPPPPQNEAASSGAEAGAERAIGVAPLDPPPPPPARTPSLAFRSPKPGEAIPVDRVDRYVVKLDVTDFPLSPGGPHLHVVLDDYPYTSVHDAAASVRLGDIAPGEPLAEGEHVLVAFPGTSDHVSIKPDRSKPDSGKSPLARVAFWVGKQGRSQLAGRGARVVYSRPKGTYNGAAADRILLDFYLIDAVIGPGLGAVRVSVTPPLGEARSVDLTSWTPHAITNLPDGDSHVRLELLDASGARAPGRWSVAEQVVTVNRAATEALGDGGTL